MSETNIHIGRLIRLELESQERTATWFARKLCCDRSNVYKLFARPTVDTCLLCRISVILNCNFFKLYASEVDRQIGESAGSQQ